MEELNIMNQPKNETIVKKYLSHYRHSPQSIKMRKSSLTYFFAEDFFNYHDHIFNINTQVLIDYFDFLKNLDSIGGATKKNKWHIRTFNKINALIQTRGLLLGIYIRL